MTLPSGSSTILSIFLLLICASRIQFGISSSSGRENSSHLSNFGVEIVGLSFSVCHKSVSCEFKESILK